MSRRQRRVRSRRRRTSARAGGTPRRAAVGAGLSLGAALGMTATAEAADFTVTSLADNGGGAQTTLREAITASDNGGGNDRIVFQSGLTGTITLNGTQLPLIDEPLQVVGPGASALTISGNNASRIFNVNTPLGADVAISGLRLIDANTVAGGGAIAKTAADLTVARVTFSGNDGGNGAAVYSFTGTLRAESLTMTGNESTNSGGAVNANNNSQVTIEDSTITGNKASNSGGGIYSYSGPLTVTGSTVSGNEAITNSGGGIFSNQSPLKVETSTVNGNRADNSGGGIYNYSDTVTIRSSTVSGNQAGNGGAGLFLNSSPTTIVGLTAAGNTGVDKGGGIYSYSDSVSLSSSTVSGNKADRGGGLFLINTPMTLETSTLSGNATTADMGGGAYFFASMTNPSELRVRNSTIASNSSPSMGGGVYLRGAGSTSNLSNAIVADNTAPAGPNLDGTFGAAFSLVESTAGGTVSTTVAGSNIVGVDPRLGPLANNGGPTLTRALLPGSPALDKGSTAAAADQRGAARPFNLRGVGNSTAAGADGADIGAYERILCAGVLVNRVGTAGKDKLKGTAKRDGILGLGGADRLLGLAGGDALCGGGGRDVLKGGKGRDRLLGQAGRDRLIGGPGRDRLSGGPGRDRQRQ